MKILIILRIFGFIYYAIDTYININITSNLFLVFFLRYILYYFVIYL